MDEYTFLKLASVQGSLFDNEQSIFIAGTVLAVLITALLKILTDFKLTKETQLFPKRSESYKELWSLTSLTPVRPPSPSSVSAESIREHIDKLRDWYFNGGGEYLSRKSQHKFNLYQDQCIKVWKEFVKPEDSTVKSGTPWDKYRELARCSHELRSEMAKDLMSRARHSWHFWVMWRQRKMTRRQKNWLKKDEFKELYELVQKRESDAPCKLSD